MPSPILLVALLAAAPPSGAAERREQPAPVAAGLLEEARKRGSADVLVVLTEQADLRNLPWERSARRREVFERLRATAASTQGAVLADLRRRGAEVRPYWIHNMIRARADAPTIEAVARQREVARIAADPRVRADLPDPEPTHGACPSGGIEASLSHLGVPELWGRGIDGAGIVVAGADTGYQWDHPALLASYRGWNGGPAAHDHHWWDAIHTPGGGGLCGPDSSEPCDDHGHGTHTLGTMVGTDGAVRIGVAPGARWIGCRNMDQGFGTPSTYAECLQFFLAPTDLAGNDPRPDLAPDVVNNSWACADFEGCTAVDPDVLRGPVEALRAAGILVVASAGNSGSSCSTVHRPPAIYDAAFTVGNSDLSDSIASSSSRGPVTFDGSGRLKPDLAAPGTSICSAVPFDAYGVSSGTSMAGPHVAGLAALALQARSCLRGDVDALETALLTGVVARTSAQGCGGLGPEAVPNHVYGFGVARAVVPPPESCPADLFADGFESGDSSAWGNGGDGRIRTGE